MHGHFEKQISPTNICPSSFYLKLGGGVFSSGLAALNLMCSALLGLSDCEELRRLLGYFRKTLFLCHWATELLPRSGVESAGPYHQTIGSSGILTNFVWITAGLSVQASSQVTRCGIAMSMDPLMFASMMHHISLVLSQKPYCPAPDSLKAVVGESSAWLDESDDMFSLFVTQTRKVLFDRLI